MTRYFKRRNEDSYGVWWFKMAIIYHRKTFVTNPKWFWGMIKSGLIMFWHDVRKIRLRVKLYRLSDTEYYHREPHEPHEPRHESYK